MSFPVLRDFFCECPSHLPDVLTLSLSSLSLKHPLGKLADGWALARLEPSVAKNMKRNPCAKCLGEKTKTRTQKKETLAREASLAAREKRLRV